MLWEKKKISKQLKKSASSEVDNHSSKSSLQCRNPRRNRKAQFDKVTIRMYSSLLTSSNHWNRHRGCHPWHINVIVTINGILGSSNVTGKKTGGSSATYCQPMNAEYYSLFSCPSGALRATLRWESNIAMQGHASEFSVCEGKKNRVMHSGLSILLW